MKQNKPDRETFLFNICVLLFLSKNARFKSNKKKRIPTCDLVEKLMWNLKPKAKQNILLLLWFIDFYRCQRVILIWFFTPIIRGGTYCSDTFVHSFGS